MNEKPACVQKQRVKPYVNSNSLSLSLSLSLYL
jgi:hypothetical protein